MTARHWWIGVGVLASAILFHAAFPRYEWHQGSPAVWIRYDRWTGAADLQKYAPLQ